MTIVLRGRGWHITRDDTGQLMVHAINEEIARMVFDAMTRGRYS